MVVETGSAWSRTVVEDGDPITGQDPQSTAAATRRLLATRRRTANR